MWVANVQGYVSLAIWILELAITGFALVDAAMRRTAAFPAADKQNKMFWLIILALGVLAQFLFGPLNFIPILGFVAGIVYVVDARPALRKVGKGGSTSNGPYGPW
jgi:hypothetical protein